MRYAPKMEVLFMSFASKLDILIEERGLNNLRLSKELGIGDRLIGAWRKGEKRPTLDNFVLLGEFLRCLAGLFGWAF